MNARLILALAALLAASLPAAADDDGARETDACQGDVHRLCDKYFPDEKLVATCLVDRRAELSEGCAELLANPPGVDAQHAAPEAPATDGR